MTDDNGNIYDDNEDSSVRWLRKFYNLPRYIKKNVKCSDCKKEFEADFRHSEKLGFDVQMQRYCWVCRNRITNYI